jgi:cytochrome b561
MTEQPGVLQNRAFAIRCYAWSRAIHWVTVALVSGLLITAPFDNIDPHGSGNRAFLWHSSLGLTVYLLSITRVLLWFVYRPTKQLAVEHEADREGRGLRYAFYVLLLALPLSGWLLASKEGMPAHLFGMPALSQWYERAAPHPSPVASEVDHGATEKDTTTVITLNRVHAVLAAALSGVICMHVFSVIRSRSRRRHL